MHKLSLLALLFSLSLYTYAQNTPPWSEERTMNVEQLTKCFVVPVVDIAPDTIGPWMKWKTVGNYTFGKNRGDIPMICDLSALHPYFRDKVIELIAICQSKGIELAVVETYRTVAKQNEYRKLGKIYTRNSGGRSKHQYGLAVDVVPVIDSVPSWHNEVVWKKVGLVGEKLGLRWGGRWRYPYDPGHFEWSGGVSGVAMEQGRSPHVPQPENYPCLDDDLAALQGYWGKWESEQKGAFVARAKKTK
jgi:hypothetical protein